jgi:CHAT domain-containing protein/tetratricopeptide (TPR) repeat protein
MEHQAQMTADEKISELLKSAEALVPGKDSLSLAAIYREAGSLVDRNAKPKKWAAFRFKFGEAMDPIDRLSALQAYREAVTYFDPVQDRSMWSCIKACIGFDLLFMGKISPPESEEAIACFEDAVGELPYVASQLAMYYEIRTVGDPLENWTKLVHYLELALSQVTPDGDPVQYAHLKNKLAMAQTAEPGGDFAAATGKRIAYHKEALAVLDKTKDVAGSPARNAWIIICVKLSEAYAGAADPGQSEQYARDAYNACGPDTAHDTRILATMSLARVLLSEDNSGSLETYRAGLLLTEEAENLIDSQVQPAMAATNLKFKELAHLQLLKLGEPDQMEPLLRAADRAYLLIDSGLYSDLQRTVSQIAADALIHSGQFARAIDYLERAADAGERTLQQATSRAGRLECIFHMHNTYALLGYCYFQGGEAAKGIEELDKGKGRWWNPAKSFARFDGIRTLVPAGGAILFPAFAPKDGAVGIVTETGAKVCTLTGFGAERLHELLLADILNPLGESWIGRYTFRHMHPDRWYQAIDSIGSKLFDLLWKPVEETLSQLGVKENAELVWFPQAGLGVLPLHAAWTSEGASRRWILDSYAIRYAPSASCLLEKQAAAPDGIHLFISNPTGNLPNSALELAWVRQAEAGKTFVALMGDQARKTEVLNELPRAKTVHFSTHAVFRMTDPFQSGVMLASGEQLVLEELLPLLKNSSVREVILSACETGLAQAHRLPDEFLGFPTAFLEHGADTVIATQWPVDDWAAAALIGVFYEEWRKSPVRSAAQAMRSAQQWLRKVTPSALMEMLAALKEQPGAAGAQAASMRTSLRKLDKTAQPFAHPYYWAGFMVSGF